MTRGAARAATGIAPYARLMAIIVEDVQVPVTAAVAFDYVADFANTVHWDPMIRAARRRSHDPIGVGSAFDVELQFGRRSVAMVYSITTHDAPARVVLETSGWWYRGRDDIRLSPGETPGSTAMRWEAMFALRGPLRLLDPLLARGFTKVAAEAVAGLVRELTRLSGSTEPPTTGA
jgi:hypothetical protein